jgi:hypothetical protein
MLINSTHPATWVTEGFGTYNAIAVAFEGDRNAYNALTVQRPDATQGA